MLILLKGTHLKSISDLVGVWNSEIFDGVFSVAVPWALCGFTPVKALLALLETQICAFL